MQILIVSQYFWPESFRINEVAVSLYDSGHQVTVISAKPNYPRGIFFPGYQGWGFQKEKWGDIEIHRIPIISRGSGNFVSLAINYLSFIVSGLIFMPYILRGKKFDVIFVYGVSPVFQVIPATFLAWLKSIPVVLWVQDLWPESVSATGFINSPLVLKILRKFVKFCYLHTDLLLVQSQAFVSQVSKLAPSKIIKYFPNSVDMSFYSPKPQSLSVEVPSLKKGFSVLFAGNVGIAQSMETIVEAAEILKENKSVRFVIVGDGSRLSWLAEEKNKRKLDNLYLEGYLPNDVMPYVMRQASALLVTLKDSPIFNLTIPNKIQAYLAVGKPIIASLNGEGSSIIEKSKAGLSVPAEDGRALAEAVLKLSLMPDQQKKQMGLNGRMFFKENFDEKKLTAQLIQHFESLF